MNLQQDTEVMADELEVPSTEAPTSSYPGDPATGSSSFDIVTEGDGTKMDSPLQMNESTDLKATLLGETIDLVQISDHLVCPRSWVTEASSHPQLENVQLFIERLSPCGKTTPWLISSMSQDLSGAPREDSPSHRSGEAMDIAPMYGDEDVLPADPPMLGLAWNLKSLIVLSQGQFGDMPMFVEGDHLHFSKEITPTDTGELAIMWSTSSTYQSAQQELYDPILPKLRNSYWLWKTPSLSLCPPSSETLQRILGLIGRSGPDQRPSSK
jgi:hypothetical protein